MRRMFMSALAVAVVLPFVALAQGKADFSGTWTMDSARSDPPPQGRGGRGGRGGPATVTITQTAAQLTIAQGPQTLTYKLDGSESTNEMAGRGGTTMAKSKARWDGAKLVIETTREVQGFSITTTDVRSLEAGGKEMILQSTTSTPQGEQSRKVVFTKTS